MKKFVLIVGILTIIIIFFSACNLVTKKKKTIRIKNRLQQEIVLTKYTNHIGNKIEVFTPPISIKSGKRVSLHSNEWFCGTKFLFSYDNDEYEMKINYTYNRLVTKAYFIETDETKYGFKAYTDFLGPNLISIRLLSEADEVDFYDKVQ